MIRTLLILALLGTALVPALAQDTFTWQPVNLVGNVEPLDLEYIFVIELTNITDQQRVYMLQFLFPAPEPTEWSRSWCTHGFCYAPFFDEVPDTLGPQMPDEDCHIQLGWVFGYPDVPDTTLYLPTRVFDQEFPDDFIETLFTLIIGEGSGVQDQTAVTPLTTSLAPVYPNPFNAWATVRFTLPAPGNASITLFDITGRQALSVADDVFSSGEHQLSLDASALASGMYLLSLRAGQTQLAQRVTVVK